MRTITTVAVSAMFLAGFAFGQEPQQQQDDRRSGQSSTSSSSSTASSSQSQEKTITGCLMKGDSADMYVLNDKSSNTKYKLTEAATASDVDFSKHINHQVRVKGREMAASAHSSTTTPSSSTTSSTQSSTSSSTSSTSSSASNGRAGSHGAEKQLQVTSLEMVSATCESGSR